jgi:LysR family transcriptional regulator, hydrogen peroxide-inducible genes activator
VSRHSATADQAIQSFWRKSLEAISFIRERSRIHITELGRIVQPCLQEAWENTQVAKRQAKDYASRAPTQLKLVMMCTIAPALLIQLFARFRSSRPDVKLELIDGTAQSVEEQLVASAAEIAIYCRPDRTPDTRLNYLPLFREQMMIVLPSMHRPVSRDQIEIPDLAGESYVQRSFCEFNDVVDSVFDARGVDRETVYRSDRDDWVLAMIASGFGFGFFPKYSISNPDVVARPLVNPEFWREASLTTVKGRPYSRAVGALVHEAMRSAWLGDVPLAVKNLFAEEAGSGRVRPTITQSCFWSASLRGHRHQLHLLM